MILSFIILLLFLLLISFFFVWKANQALQILAIKDEARFLT